jgi:hypothetical protein
MCFVNFSGVMENHMLTGTITFPNSITSIGIYSFYSCASITSVTFGNRLKSIGDSAFFNCVSLSGDLIIPDSVISIENAAFNNCNHITTVAFGTGLKSIGESAFGYCTSLAGNLIIPDSVTSIGSEAFSKCNNITSVTIGSNLQVLGERAFLGCTKLITDYDIVNDAYPNNKISCNDDNVYYLRNDETYYCLGKYENIKSEGTLPSGEITIVDGTKILCGDCFHQCINVTNINILPSSVKFLGRSVFNTCAGITQSDLDLSNIISIGEGSFAFANFSGTLTISSNLINVDSSILYSSNFSSIVMKNFTKDFSYDN